MRRLVALVAGVGILLLGASTVVVSDSPYDPNVVSERNPFAPERPAHLDESTAASFLVEYEETRFYDDLLGSRDHTFDTHDTVRAACTATATNRTGADRFRVRLHCEGGIDDTKRIVDPTQFSYTVTYRMTEDAVAQLAIRDYPFASRDELRVRPTAAE